MRSVASAITLMVLFCLSVTGNAQASPNPQLQKLELRFIAPILPPLYSLDENNIPQGRLITLFSQIASNAGISWTTRMTSAPEVMTALIRGQADVSILVRNPKLDRSGTVLVGHEPLGRMTLNVYYLPQTKTVNSVDDLKQSSLVAMQGYGYGGFRNWLNDSKNRVTVIDVKRPAYALRMLEAKRVQYALIYQLRYSETIKLTRSSFTAFAHSTLSSIPFYLHISKAGVKNPETLLQTLTDSHKSLMQQGRSN